MSYGDFGSSLRDLPRLRTTRRRRASSWDRTGGNDDRLHLVPGASAVLADILGAGVIEHLWVTVAPQDVPHPEEAELDYLRRLRLTIRWDGEDEAAVDCPLSDFFGVGHGRTVNFAAAPLQMSPQDGRGLNCFFHMPFRRGARIEVTSLLDHTPVYCYYYIDYAEHVDGIEPNIGYFHARYTEQDCHGQEPEGDSNHEFQLEGTNLSGQDNYVILDRAGRGQYVGCVLSIRNRRETDLWNWYGEGDDMIFIDGEPFPPSLHGTGTEDYFNTAWCPDQFYAAPYHGITLPGGPNWSGEISLYRFHVEDPITFSSSIRVTIEHGHANKRADFYSSVAYWYEAH